MKTVNTRKFLDEMTALLEAGHGITIPVAGTSMEPFLKDQRDQVYLEKTQTDTPLRSGEIVLFTRPDGQYVLHRIVKVSSEQLIIRGDNQLWTETISPEQVRGVVRKVRRNGNWITSQSNIWKFFEGPWNKLTILRKLAGWIHGHQPQKQADEQK